MGNFDYKSDYRRNLPHIQPPSATLFVTFRLSGSLPRAALEEAARWKAQFDRELALLPSSDERKRHEHKFRRQHFARLEKYLDAAQTGPTWLREGPVARQVADALRRRDGKAYQLEAYCLMPNHVHTVFTPLPVVQADGSCYHSLASIMHAHSRAGPPTMGINCSAAPGHSGNTRAMTTTFETNGNWRHIIGYVLGNPLKAGLVADWRAWPWSYCRVPM